MLHIPRLGGKGAKLHLDTVYPRLPDWTPMIKKNLEENLQHPVGPDSNTRQLLTTIYVADTLFYALLIVATTIIIMFVGTPLK